MRPSTTVPTMLVLTTKIDE